MTKLWRISRFTDLSGEGGKIASGRWHTKGKPIVYLADSPASALLERIVHLQDGNGRLPLAYELLQIAAPESLAIKELMPRAFANWKEQPARTQRLGDAWLTSLETPLAKVPSVIVPQTWNYLLNPAHPDANHVRVESVLYERFDNRLFRVAAH